MQSKYSKSISADFEVITVKTIEGIEDIRPIWEDMQKKEPYPVINADIDRFITVIQASNGELQPYVMLFRRAGCPEAMLIGLMRNEPFELRFGHKALLRPSLHCVSITYGGIIGRPQSDFSALMIRELMKKLRHSDFDMICFNHLRQDSLFYELIQTMPGILSRGYFPEIRPLWTMEVTGSIDRFYQARSKKHRANLRRYMRKLEKEYRNRVEIITYMYEDLLDDAIKSTSKISQKTYQYAFGTGFRDNKLTRSMLTTAAKHDWLRLSVMYIDKEPCAFQLGFHYGKAYILEQIGFDPKWEKFNIGTVLFLRVLEDVFKNPQIELFDFSFYDYEYKRSYADTQRSESTLYIFAPRLFPISVNLAWTGILGLSNLVKYLIGKMGIYQKVKEYRRKIVEKRNRKAQAKLKLAASKNQGQSA